MKISKSIFVYIATKIGISYICNEFKIQNIVIHPLLLELFRQIDQIEPVGRTCEGRVKPAVEIFPQHFFRDIADIQKDVHPLAALCLVAGDGIGEFDLQDVVVGIGFHLFHLSRLCRDIFVIFEDGKEELVVQLFR